MAKGQGGTRSNPYYAREVRAGEPSPRRISDNHREANRLEKEGYSVERDLHKNGAYFAVIGEHKEHEITVGKILAENGISVSLDREGNVFFKLPDGRRMKLPTPDGHIERDFTHEIYALQGEPNIQTVADGIAHSYKLFRANPSKSIQSDIAITFTPLGSHYRREDIDAGVEEFIRRVSEGETKANPLVYLHIDEGNRKVYTRRIKKKRE
jgi:hypothetical protein